MKSGSKNQYIKRLHALIDIGVALSSEKELSRLLDASLIKACEVSGCEAAHIYLIHEKATQRVANVVSLQKEKVLHFVKSYHIARGIKDEQTALPLNSQHIASHVAFCKELVNLEDCYDIPKDQSFHFDESLETLMDRKSKSLLALPLITGEGKVLGVLKLINKLSNKGREQIENEKSPSQKSILSFYFEDEELIRIFTSYVAIALENAKLSENIENLFESFVRASVKAIESRDPTTSGHSDRVAMMTVELALATHKVGEGPFKQVSFSEEQLKEIRYASLLHDFGKIGVTEQVLLKKKKLQDRELESILLRFDTMGHNEETRIWRELCERAVEFQRQGTLGRFDADKAVQGAAKQIESIKQRLKQMRSQVITANEPQVMSRDFNIDELIAKLVHGNHLFNNAVLTQSEIKTLSIPKGSLNLHERKEIESHVSHTYEFLKQIAWTDNLSHVTTIAHCHHEKMDGSGYPRHIKGDEIPIQARMMTIADIYDALTAFDRPYKKPLPPHMALEILIKDARAGKIDGHLLKIFIEAGIFHHATLGTHKKAS